MKTIILTAILLALPWTVSADSTTIQLHITADALMIRMPSNHWFVLIEDSVAHYVPEYEGMAIPILNPIPRIVEYYTRRLRFVPTDSIPKTSNSTVHVERFPKNAPIFEIHSPPCGDGLFIIGEDCNGPGFLFNRDSTKEDK